MAERWLLPPLWFDLCWETGRFDEYPFPLAVRSHGATFEERAVLRQRAEPEMHDAGLLGPGGLSPRFGEVLSRIAKPGLWIEGMWIPDDTVESPVRLLSIGVEEGALLVVQEPGDTESHGGDMRISVHPKTSVAAAVVQGMPPTPPGKRPRLAVPVTDMAPRGDDDGGSMMQSVAPRGRRSPADQLRAIADETHFRDGQFTANLRDRFGRSHRSAVLKWFDAPEPDGRYGLIQHVRPGVGPELVVAPLGPAEITSALENRVKEVRTASQN